MFKNPFSFEGRIRRTEFCISYIIYLFVYFCISLISAMQERAGILMLAIALIAIIPLIWFLLAQGAKRCHDRNNTGWFQIIPFYMLWMLFADGDPHYNQYGNDPKGRGEDFVPENTYSDPDILDR